MYKPILNLRIKIAATLMTTIGLTFCAAINPSNAQSSYLPWAVGSSLLQPLRYLSYSAYGGSGYSNPIWYGGKILQQTTRGMGGIGYNGYSPYGNPNFYAINNDERGVGQNPSQQPQQVIRYGFPTYASQNGRNAQRNGSNNQGNGSNQQNNGNSSNFTAGNNQSQNNNSNNNNNFNNNNFNNNSASSAGKNNFNNNNNFNDNGHVASGINDDPFPSPVPTPISRPRNGSGSNFSAMHSGNFGKRDRGTPTASSFVETVNNQYNGDIEKALVDPQNRTLAHSLGLTTNLKRGQLNLSEDRKNTIGRIMNDSSLDPTSKLAAVKALLH